MALRGSPRNTKNALPGQACRLRRRHLPSSRRSQGRGCSWLKSYATRRLEILSGKRRCSSAISCSLPGVDGASFNASDLARAARPPRLFQGRRGPRPFPSTHRDNRVDLQGVLICRNGLIISFSITEGIALQDPIKRIFCWI